MGNGVRIEGVEIKKITGHNAKFIVDNEIGIGAIIRVSRRGSVIPHVEEVIKPAKKIGLPKDIDYEWNKTGVDIYAIQKSSELEVKKINNFFRSLGLESVSEKNFAKLYDNGFDTINKIINMTKKDLLGLPGIKETMANKIYTGIQDCIKDVNLSSLMYASCCFNGEIGTRRFDMILKAYPDVLSWNCSSQDVSKIANLNMFSDILANSFVKGLKKFKLFLNKLSNKVTYILPKKINKRSSSLDGEVIVMTGFRDKDISKFIVENGGEEGSSVSKKTTLLLVKDKNSTSGKATKARELGIKIMSRDEFVNKYM